MKREVWNHPKTWALAGHLGISRAHAGGIIGILLNYTADVAPQGDIGKWPDAVIAGACDWRDDPHEFVEALTESGWLDEHPNPKVRLIIHDLEDHAQNWWKQKLKKLGLDFIRLPQSDEELRPADAEPTLSDRSEPSILQTSSNQTSANLLSPNGLSPASDETPEAEVINEPVTDMVFPVKVTEAWPHATWTLTTACLADYERRFPNADVRGLIQRALDWVKDVPSRKKTGQGMKRFLTTWLQSSRAGPASANRSNRSSGTYKGSTHGDNDF